MDISSGQLMKRYYCLLYENQSGKHYRDIVINTDETTKLTFKDTLLGIQRDTDFPRCEDSNSYKKHLELKFGIRVNTRYFDNDQASMDKLGGSMSGNDVVIAPNILNQMATDREKASYYEQKIKYYFDNVPRWKREFAAMGLSYEPCGVAIHEDGTVYYIGGCTETPERKKKIEAAQKAKEMRKLEHWQEQQDYSKKIIEHKRIIVKAVFNNTMRNMPMQSDTFFPMEGAMT